MAGMRHHERVARPPGGTRGYELRVLVLLGLAFGFAYFDRMALTFLAPFVQADLDAQQRAARLGQLGPVADLGARRVPDRPLVGPDRQAQAVPDRRAAAVLAVLGAVGPRVELRDPARHARGHGRGRRAVPADLPGDHGRRLGARAARRSTPGSSRTCSARSSAPRSPRSRWCGSPSAYDWHAAFFVAGIPGPDPRVPDLALRRRAARRRRRRADAARRARSLLAARACSQHRNIVALLAGQRLRGRLDRGRLDLHAALSRRPARLRRPDLEQRHDRGRVLPGGRRDRDRAAVGPDRPQAAADRCSPS